jgi:non-heme chloroperoxidase
LHVTDPVLVGHSIAGEELSAISTYDPGRSAALVYLDAGGAFALYNPKHGDYTPALAQLKDDLSALQKNLFDDDLISKTLTDMALFQANLAELRGEVEGATPPSPKASDLVSISAFQTYMKGYFGGVIPESEVRQDFRIGEDGRIGEWLGHGYPNQSVMLEEERFHSIETPLLAIFSYPSAPPPSVTSDPAKFAAFRAAETTREEAQISMFREQPHAKVIVIPNATHYIFLSREEEVISSITEFVNRLPSQP